MLAAHESSAPEGQPLRSRWLRKCLLVLHLLAYGIGRHVPEHEQGFWVQLTRAFDLLYHNLRLKQRQWQQRPPHATQSTLIHKCNDLPLTVRC